MGTCNITLEFHFTASLVIIPGLVCFPPPHTSAPRDAPVPSRRCPAAGRVWSSAAVWWSSPSTSCCGTCPSCSTTTPAFSHTVDETLQLQRGLAQLGYGGGGGEQPGPLTAVCQPGYLRRWVAIERKYALERVDQMLASETAWAVQGEPEGGVTEVSGAGEVPEGRVKRGG